MHVYACVHVHARVWMHVYVRVCVTDTALWRAMSGEHAHSNSAKKHLTAHFASLAAAPPGGGKKGGRVPPVTVCLMDEIDFLMTRDENVIYSFFDWPLTRQSRLIVVGVSNVMDLPERLSTRSGNRRQ